MYYYEPYLMHKGGRIKGSKNGFHIYGPQQSAKHYKLGANTVGFVESVKNVAKGTYEAAGGLKTYRAALKAERNANKLYQEAEKHKAQAAVYQNRKDGVLSNLSNALKADSEVQKYLKLRKQADEMKARAEKIKSEADTKFGKAISLSPRFAKILISAVKTLYTEASRVRTFITNYGNKIMKSRIDRHNDSERLKAMINPKYKPKYKKYY